MGEVLDIDLSSYKPVEPLPYYADVNILDTGSVRPTEPIPDHVLDYLQCIGADVALWDGSKGVLGRNYLSSKATEKPVSTEEIQMLRAQYLEVKKGLAATDVNKKLKKQLESQEKLHRLLNLSVFTMEQEVEKLRKLREACEVENGEQNEEYVSLNRQLGNLIEELNPSKEAAARILKKVQQTKVEIAESETGYLRRMALLRRIFSDGGAKLAEFLAADLPRQAQIAEKAEERARLAIITHLQSKGLYVDAKTGMVHMFKIAEILKDILEHLREGMNTLQGTVDSSRLGASAKGFEFRLGYVRKLWGMADSSFKTALPYIKYTSLRHTPVSREDAATIEQDASKRSSGSGSGGKKFGIFETVPTILPSFTKIELSHPLSRRSRISALHKSAASAYRDVNLLYDFHEKMTTEAFVVLQRKEQEEQQAHEDLIAIWEDLLGVPKEGSSCM